MATGARRSMSLIHRVAFTFSLLLISALRNSALCSEATPSREVKINIDGKPLLYRVYKESVPGLFLLAPRVADRFDKNAHLLALDRSGSIFKDKALTHPFGIAVVEFKNLGSGHYIYFTLESLEKDNGKGDQPLLTQAHLLDSQFNSSLDWVLPNNDPALDSHEVTLTKNGNLLFLFYRSRDNLVHAEVQERTPQGKLLYKWNSQKDFSPPDSTFLKSPDYLHANTIDEDADGNLLLSFSNQDEVVKVTRPGGKLLWRFSPKRWKILGDPWGGFHLQHTPRRLPNGNLLIFDNGGGDSHPEVSRAVEYRLDESKLTATLVWEYRADATEPYRNSLGSAQRLSNGNTLIGWGSPDLRKYHHHKGEPLTLFTEVDPSGQKVCELIGYDEQISYRVEFQERNY